jgi:hypothetical protein
MTELARMRHECWIDNVPHTWNHEQNERGGCYHPGNVASLVHDPVSLVFQVHIFEIEAQLTS